MMLKTDARVLYEVRQRGVTKPKPTNFSDTMRLVNPPKGIKIKYDSRDKSHDIRYGERDIAGFINLNMQGLVNPTRLWLYC